LDAAQDSRLIESRSEKGKVMSNWHDIKGDNPAPHGRLLLLLTQPQTFDGAEPDIYDILVGYRHKKKWNSFQRSTQPRVEVAR
jgi:hypothetical protein